MCSGRDRNERSTRADNRQPNSAIQEIARRRMAKQLSQASLDARETQFDSTASNSEFERQHRVSQPTADADSQQDSMAAACDRAGPALVDLTQGSNSRSDEAAGVFRGDSKATAIALEDDLSDSGLDPADPAASAQLQQHRGEPRRLNRLRRAGNPKPGSSAASSTARREPADDASASIAGLVSGFGSLQVRFQPILQHLYSWRRMSFKESVHSHRNVCQLYGHAPTGLSQHTAWCIATAEDCSHGSGSAAASGRCSVHACCSSGTAAPRHGYKDPQLPTQSGDQHYRSVEQQRRTQLQSRVT